MFSKEKFREFIYKLYPTSKKESTDKLTDELTDIIEDCQFDLADAVHIIDAFEQKENIPQEWSDGVFFALMDEIIYSLENTKENTDRLYELVMDSFELHAALNKIFLYNAEHLSEAQKKKLLPLLESQGFDTEEL